MGSFSLSMNKNVEKRSAFDSVTNAINQARGLPWDEEMCCLVRRAFFRAVPVDFRREISVLVFFSAKGFRSTLRGPPTKGVRLARRPPMLVREMRVVVFATDRVTRRG